MTIESFKKCCEGITGHKPSTILAGGLALLWVVLSYYQPGFVSYFEKATGMSVIAFLMGYKGKK
jgi:hypothetical protein